MFVDDLYQASCALLTGHALKGCGSLAMHVVTSRHWYLENDNCQWVLCDCCQYVQFHDSANR